MTSPSPNAIPFVEFYETGYQPKQEQPFDSQESERECYLAMVIQFLKEKGLLGLFRPQEGDAEWLEQCGVWSDSCATDQEVVFQFLDWALEQDDPQVARELFREGCPAYQMMNDYLLADRAGLELDGDREETERVLIQSGIDCCDPRLILAHFVAMHCYETPEDVIDLQYLIQMVQQNEIWHTLPDQFRLVLGNIDWCEILTSQTPIPMAQLGDLTIYYLGKSRTRTTSQELVQLLEPYCRSWSRWC